MNMLNLLPNQFVDQLLINIFTNRAINMLVNSWSTLLNSISKVDQQVEFKSTTLAEPSLTYIRSENM